MCLLLLKVFTSFLRLSNGDAVALTFTIDIRLVVVVASNVVVVVVLPCGCVVVIGPAWLVVCYFRLVMYGVL